MQDVASEDAVHGLTIRAIEWAFHTPTAPWRAASIRLDLMAVEATAANSAVSAAAIPARQLEAALTPGRALVDGAPSMATIGRPPAMASKHPQLLAGQPRKVLALPRRITAHPAPRKVIAMRLRTIALPRRRTRAHAAKAIPPHDPIHRRAVTLLHRPAGAFPARAPSQPPAPQEEASPVDTQASLEGGIPEAGVGIPAEEAGGSGAFAQEIMPFLTAYKISSARLCRFSFS